MQGQSNWFDLYCRAILESDFYRINDRVDTAARSIQQELLEGNVDTREKQEMERCLRYLTMLSRVENKLAS